VQAVLDEGGFEVITRDKKWAKIAVRLCYQASKNIGSTLRQHYEKTLYPFDVFMTGATTDAKVSLRLYVFHGDGIVKNGVLYCVITLHFCISCTMLYVFVAG